MYSADLSLGANLSFAGTGITGFMRDGGSVSDIGCYTGTFNGGNNTITLAIGEKYGDGITSSSTVEGVGQIYRHQHNGLFSNLAGTVQNLTIDGTINVSNCVAGMNIGGVASRNGGNITLTKVVANEVVNYNESTSVSVDTSKAEGKNIGGYIGYVGTGGNITINGVSSIGATFNLSGKHQSWNVYGGAIGKVTSGTFNITIGTKDDATNKLTVGMVADVSGVTDVGGNGDCGGLIGHITSAGSYGTRIVNINNLIFNDVTVGNTTKTPTIANAANTNAGGFLGYSWLNSTVNINGLTVTKGNINNFTTDGTAGGNANVGVMCYEATGKWNVDKLTVTNMTMSNGGGTSVGMLVNKAYSGDDGLYLNVLNLGYTLTAATLPSLKKFDEIAAYSAKDAATVVQGGKGVGVISINMNATRDTANASVTTSGTYQNKLSVTSSTQNSNYDNNTSRYYYNLDIMDKGTDTAQDIVLWSVNQYAASNIKNEFDFTSNPFACESETNVALSAYSYYPVYNVSSQTLSKINIEFGYNGIYTLEGNSTLNTDSYNRDPGELNQHYLMQSGLFINSAENSTITLDTVKLNGDFLENATYQGVLISGTASGSISIDGLVLDGITPKYNNSGTISIYNTGYLLVKNVNRADSTKGNIQINLKNISTSNKYTVSSSTATVAKSLFGDVYGPAIGINIEDVKIDARSANGGLSALDTAYGTQNSIFTTATFFNSIKTSQAATMIYNYTLADDWNSGRNVTYGKEVKDSVEYAGQENKYYNSTTNYTDPTTNSNTTSGYDFGSWRPYVGQPYTANQTADANGCFYREIKVNVAAVAYSDGCGTYNDPYIIDSGAKLTAIAALINDASKTSDLPSVILPKTLYNGVAANTTGARWCDSKNDHAVYTWNGSNYTSTDSTAVWSVENVRLYLANAYYSISASTDNTSGDIVLGSGFLGLGGTADTTDNSGKFAFRGVIVGNGRTIVNNSQNPLVKVSNGCVIKGLTVNQNVDVNVAEQKNAAPANAYFGYNSQCSYYGGLIGEIMGGDNIIDNSYVTWFHRIC